MFYVLELYYRIIYIIFSFAFSFFLTFYLKDFYFIYFFSKISSKRQMLSEKAFLTTTPLDNINFEFSICLLFSIFAVLPFFFFTFFYFFSSSFTSKELNIVLFNINSLFIRLYFFNLFFVLYLIEYLWDSFEIINSFSAIKNLVTIEHEPSLVGFFYFFVQFIFLCNVFLIFTLIIFYLLNYFLFKFFLRHWSSILKLLLLFFIVTLFFFGNHIIFFILLFFFILFYYLHYTIKIIFILSYFQQNYVFKKTNK